MSLIYDEESGNIPQDAEVNEEIYNIEEINEDADLDVESEE